MRNTLEKVKREKFLVDSYIFTHNGLNILLDVNNSNFYSVEKIYCDVVNYMSSDEISADEIRNKYEEQQIEEVLNNLMKFGFICDEEPTYEKIAIARDKEVINLVINVSHNCNLRCKYCFAATGSYNGEEV